MYRSKILGISGTRWMICYSNKLGLSPFSGTLNQLDNRDINGLLRLHQRYNTFKNKYLQGVT